MTSEDLGQTRTGSRPESVVWYERLAWAAIAVGLASGAANPALLARNYHLYHTGFLLYGALSVTGQLLWIWLVARKRQNWARWISLFWILLSILGIESTIRDMERFLNPVAAILFYAAFAISIVSVMLLFRSDAREWFSRKRVASGA